MTKWTRMRRRKERRRAEEVSARAEGEEKPTEPERISENIQHSQEIEKPESTKTSKLNTILSQIPRYAYLLAIFALLAGVFFPAVISGASFDFVIQGTAILFLGLIGAILLFKAATLDKKRGVFIAIGFALIVICLALIYHIQQTFSLYLQNP